MLFHKGDAYDVKELKQNKCGGVDNFYCEESLMDYNKRTEMIFPEKFQKGKGFLLF